MKMISWYNEALVNPELKHYYRKSIKLFSQLKYNVMITSTCAFQIPETLA